MPTARFSSIDIQFLSLHINGNTIPLIIKWLDKSHSAVHIFHFYSWLGRVYDYWYLVGSETVIGILFTDSITVLISTVPSISTGMLASYTCPLPIKTRIAFLSWTYRSLPTLKTNKPIFAAIKTILDETTGPCDLIYNQMDISVTGMTWQWIRWTYGSVSKLPAVEATLRAPLLKMD